MIRQPHVAGSFYPSDASELKKFCRAHLTSSEPKIKPRAVILPHAGYIYSGALACKVLSRVEIPSSVLLIGPNHRGAGSDFAVFAAGQWETPLGTVAVDEDTASLLLKSSPGLRNDEAAHAFEHSLEVLVPLLQSCGTSTVVRHPRMFLSGISEPDSLVLRSSATSKSEEERLKACGNDKVPFKMIPLIVGTLDLNKAREAALQMGEALAGRMESLLVVISNDMSHYEADAITRRKDKYALDAILNLDSEALISAVKKYNITMCGLVPVYMLLIMKDLIGIQKATLTGYSTSGDVTGDRERVVGYAGFIFE